MRHTIIAILLFAVCIVQRSDTGRLTDLSEVLYVELLGQDSTCFHRPGEELSSGPFYRTYTGHEDLWMFGLLNANARLYSPYLGRFVSHDPILAEDGSPLDFNPYVYARNNPYRYIDRNGEFWWFAAFALAGAAFNVCSNIDNIHSVWDALGFAGAGAVAGAVGSFAGPAAAGVLGLGTSGAISFAVSGFISGATSNIFQGALNSAVMGVPYSFNWQSCLMEAGISAVTAGVIGGITSKGNFWTGDKKLNDYPQ